MSTRFLLEKLGSPAPKVTAPNVPVVPPAPPPPPPPPVRRGQADEMSTGKTSSLRERMRRELPDTLHEARTDGVRGRIIGPGDEGPLVDEWQRDLVKLGYLSPRDARDEKRFGPKTAEATLEFKRDHGLDGKAVWNRAALAMEKALKAAKSKAVAKWDVPYIPQMSSKGRADDWNEDSNCGPASLAMIHRAFGLRFHGSDGKLINWLSNLEGYDPGGKTAYEIQDIANHRGTGLHAGKVHQRPDLDWIRKSLKAGKLIMAEGVRGVTLDAVGQKSSARGNHWIVVRGIDRHGNFLVSDPSTRCKKLTPQQLAKFFAKQESGGWAVAISKER